MSEDRSSVSERLRALVEKWRERAPNLRESGYYARNDRSDTLEACADELADALLSAEVHASTGEGLRAQLLFDANFLAAESKLVPDEGQYLRIADRLREAAAALPSPPTPAAPQEVK